MAVGIGDWTATRELNGIDADARDLGLEANIAELATYGFTTLPSLLDPRATGGGSVNFSRSRHACWRQREKLTDLPSARTSRRRRGGAVGRSASLTDPVQSP